jgi:RNA polymerase sigma-70 factor (ECF subfamily)
VVNNDTGGGYAVQPDVRHHTADEIAEGPEVRPPRNGGFAGFVDFYKADAERLVGFVIKLGASPHDAADIAQTALSRLLTRWEEVETPRAWTRKTATRLFLKSIPAGQREVCTETVPELPTKLLSPEACAENAAAAREINELLDALPSQQRMVMAWRMDNFTNIEIAQVLNTTPAAIATAYQRARNSLREVIKAKSRREEVS